MGSSGPDLYSRARARIPGGTQLLSKRPEMFLPEHWPSYYRKARGVEVWDLDDRRYVDMSFSGIGACVLGFADPRVNAAVIAAVEEGSMSTLNVPEEVALADALCELHPWADMVRYARSGGEAMAIAVRIARAATGRDVVAFCGYHGWHDWYLAANLADDAALDGHLLPGLAPAGVPRGLRGSALPFRYGHIDELEAIVESTGRQLAAVVMEPARSRLDAEFLRAAAALAGQAGAVLVFDEITSGFRLNAGGVHLLSDVRPDIAVLAKALGNGFPIAAVIGTRATMDAAQSTFISSTSWTERIGPVAALATISVFRSEPVADHLVRIGKQVKACLRDAAEFAGIAIELSGLDPLAHFEIQGPDARVAHTFFTQAMLERGFLAARSFYATYAHRDEHVKDFAAAARDVFTLIRRHRDDATLEASLQGPIAHTGFHRLA